MNRWGIAGIVAMACWLATSPSSAQVGWKAGVAKAKITPQEPMWMAGYGGRDHAAEGTTSDLWVKSLALEDAQGRRVVLVTLDLVGIDAGTTRAVTDKLKQTHQLDRQQIAICTSHTHCGPVVAYNLRPMHFERVTPEHQEKILAYARKLVDDVVATVAKSLESLEPAQVSWGAGRCTFAVNRRTNKEAEVPQMRAIGKLNGPVDHDVPVLAVRAPDGRLRSVVFGYACHATVLSFFQWCADYPGFAQTELERLHPDAVALFWAGCGADQNPLPRRTVELAQEYGRRLAVAVDDVINSPMTPVAPAVQSTYREIPLPLDTLPTRDAIAKDAESKDGFVAARAKMFLRDLDAGKPLSPTYPYPVGEWKLGDDVQWVFLGGEVVIDYAVRIKQERRGSRTWVAGYANDVMAYIPSRRVLQEGGYEGGGAMVYYGLPTVWKPEVESLIVDAVSADK
ncbi:MAG: neutral/alkaline non-lysosomal ceramidase N-terminal domain-containing protein [Pirellulales bacterium]